MENIKLREKIGYGLGDAASSMFWKLFTMYLLFFYTDVVGISSAVVGTMFLITRIWDTFLDPFVGSGTTCYIAMKNNRKSIGIDINKDFINYAQERCDQEN